MDYSTSMYYTFSTIAQVLAAFLALSGVFVLFKLQELKKMQIGEANRYLTRIKYLISLKYNKISSINLETSISAESIPNIIYEMNSLINEKEFADYVHLPTLKINIQRVLIINEQKDVLKKVTKISFYTGIVTIIYSIIILSCTHLISSFLSIIFITGIMLTITTIVLMLWVILKSFKEIQIK